MLAALIGVSSLMLFIALSASRTFALVTYYGAPIEIYGSLPEKPLEWLLDKKPSDDINVCVGDEWYRFPSHFHLPNKSIEYGLSEVLLTDLCRCISKVPLEKVPRVHR